MENFHLSVIPAQAGIHWLQVLGDPCLRRDDGEEAFFNTREACHRKGGEWESTGFKR